jgi:hypothetical protein
MDNAKPATAPAAPQPHEITLEQFATELSLRDKRVGLVNGFVFTERKARNFKALPAAFQARYDAFVVKPA